MRYSRIARTAPDFFTRNRLCLGDIGPQHGDDLVSLVAACSPESRYSRFHTGMDALRPSMAAQLADLTDGLALGLWTRTGRLVAEARYSRLAPQTAEAAILVADQYHGRRLGLHLLAVVFERAADDGVQAIHAEVLPSNDAVTGLLTQLTDIHTIGHAEGARVICLPLTPYGCPVCAPAVTPSDASRR